MNLSRIQRLLQLLGLLQSGRPQNVDSLAVECGVSRRTIFRDLDTLRGASVPLAFDSETQRYHIPDTYFLSPTNLNAEEALSVMVLCSELGDGGGLPYYSNARKAATKLENSLPDRLKSRLRRVSGAVEIKLNHSPQPEEAEEVYQQLVDAVGHRRSVRIRYKSLFDDGEEIGTKLSPYKLLFSRHSWYVIGRSSLHRSTRTFKVGRIQSLESLEDEFKIPTGFRVERYLRSAWHMIPEEGPDQEVVVRFHKLVASNVAEVQWHKTQQVTWNDDGSIDFRVTVSGLREMSWWILGYGEQATVLSPPEMQQIVVGHARAIIDKYPTNSQA
ncbi:WYL domain-containing protein [Blastopirellula sp. JC732]|uniref:WYL domain-containing protein n=1 Tax=Blastopirellula sediminis TaxID=2894196 RepID=A0A9X1MJL9_9BACT|nr:WYL domain-containing protein [Blastopirellula sediminis]MCC9609682.1 WYL domain-containing protein [Blastopirellula sediminis]MCC9627542.1 WYL domain-containing protein [Blastopirellula sediminis]